MTTEDEHGEIGRMYVEREDVQRRLACLGNKSLRLEKTLRETTDALKMRREEDGSVMLAQEFPTHEQIKRLLDDQSQLKSRLQNLNNFFAARNPAG